MKWKRGWGEREGEGGQVTNFLNLFKIEKFLYKQYTHTYMYIQAKTKSNIIKSKIMLSRYHWGDDIERREIKYDVKPTERKNCN